MEAAVDDWNNEAEKELEVEQEQEQGLQRKRVLLQRSTTSTSSDNEIQGEEGQDFNKLSEKTEKLEVITTTQVNSEMIILQQENTEKTTTILPQASYPSIFHGEGSTSLTNVTTTEIRTVSIVKEIEQGRQELYLERVYQKPPTHGFYCPNCKACIQTVYIQKGEWEEQQQQPSTAPAKPMQPKPVEPIRCTSCFSFLIPIGNWLFPCLGSEEEGALNDQGNKRLPKHSQSPEGTTQEDKAPKQDQSNEVTQPGSKDTSKPDNNIADDSGKDLNIIKNEVPLGPGIKKGYNETEDETKGTGPGSIPGNNNIASQDSSNNNNSIETSQDLQQKRGQVPPKKKKKHFWSNWRVIGGVSDDEASLLPKKSDPKLSDDWRVIQPDASRTDKPKQPEIIDFPSSSVEEKPDHVEVTVHEGSTGQTEQPVTDESTGLLPSRELPVTTRGRSSKRWEILKSVVYGGLTESLASLSVVTSAASADATTLNIVALAIANLIGGLFVLGHNLRELKAEKPKASENQTTNAQVDRYNELLGQRENFILHAFIAILSFIVFGLVPPIVYGFTFRETDEKDYKLAAVAVSSLFCITLLSIAKAHIQRPRSYVTYFKTVAYYVTTGAVASVVSYLAGQLVNEILEKLGWFEPTITSNFALQNHGYGVSVHKAAWSSY